MRILQSKLEFSKDTEMNTHLTSGDIKIPQLDKTNPISLDYLLNLPVSNSSWWCGSEDIAKRDDAALKESETRTQER